MPRRGKRKTVKPSALDNRNTSQRLKTTDIIPHKNLNNNSYVGKTRVAKLDYANMHTNGPTLPMIGSSVNADGDVNKVDYCTPQYSKAALRRVATHYRLLKEERGKIVLWRHPLMTLEFFFKEFFYLLCNYGIKLWSYRRVVLLVATFIIAIYVGCSLPGPHQPFLEYAEKKLIWSFYWIGLGMLSSIGLGTGLHTFLLYLGPHIASVTLAAYECNGLNFPEPPYPTEIICPEHGNASSMLGTVAATSTVSLWAIMSKVRLEAFMWGAGTALGELPPYFMARAARLSGQEPDDEDYEKFEHLLRQTSFKEQKHWSEKAKLAIERLVERVGFLGILLCASIPNPLFDLAGITCGHFLVPFWTFFGATLIGKAVVKMHIQQVFVIMTFSEHHVEKLVAWIKHIPRVGASLQAPLKEYLRAQKVKMHRKPGASVPTKVSWLQWIFESIVIVMVVYFILSIINSLAQNYHKRLHKDRMSKEHKMN